MRALYTGAPPEHGQLLGTHGDWECYRLTLSNSGSVNLKVICLEPSPKANFWMTWRLGEMHYKDAALLEKNHPDVYAWVVQLCERRAQTPKSQGHMRTEPDSHGWCWVTIDGHTFEWNVFTHQVGAAGSNVPREVLARLTGPPEKPE